MMFIIDGIRSLFTIAAGRVTSVSREKAAKHE